MLVLRLEGINLVAHDLQAHRPKELQQTGRAYRESGKQLTPEWRRIILSPHLRLIAVGEFDVTVDIPPITKI